MKLLKPKTGYWVFGGGNVNTVTTLVEVRWLEFRTGVRFPSSPPKRKTAHQADERFFLVLMQLRAPWQAAQKIP